MTSAVTFEPFLEDSRVVFHTDFALIDTAMNTSEINPFHLAIPHLKPIKPELSSPTQQTPAPRKEPEKKEPEKVPEVPGAAPPSPSSPPHATAPAPAPVTPITQVAPQQRTPQNSPSSITVSAQPSPSNKQNNNSMKLIDDPSFSEPRLTPIGFWMTPLPVNKSATFYIYVLSQNNRPSSIILSDEKTKEPIFQASRVINSDNEMLAVSYRGERIGTMFLNASSLTAHFGATGFEPAIEIAATIFNQTYLNESKAMAFDFIIPALKKHEGKSRVLSITLEQPSSLVQRFIRMSKEAIKLKTKQPTPKDNGYDMTFEGKFSMAHPCNFLLYHDSNPRRFLCSFGFIGNEAFSLDVSYPMCPLQAFIAAACSILHP